jgi:hypothetical protein
MHAACQAASTERADQTQHAVRHDNKNIALFLTTGKILQFCIYIKKKTTFLFFPIRRRTESASGAAPRGGRHGPRRGRSTRRFGLVLIFPRAGGYNAALYY